MNLAKDTGASGITAASKTCNGSTGAAVSAYFAKSHPVAVGSTGQRSFSTDTRGDLLRQHWRDHGRGPGQRQQ